MEGVRQWAFALCTAMVVCAVAQMLLPKGNMQKIMQVTMSVFFLCCLLSPIVLQDAELRIELQEDVQQEIDQRAAQLTSEVERQTDQAAQTRLAKLAWQELVEAGINPQAVTIHMNEIGQSTPRVRIRLTKADRDKDEQVRKIIKQALGLETELLYTEEE